MFTDNEAMPKSKFRMCVTVMKKVDNSENGSQQFEVKESKWVKGNGAQFKRDFYESKENGENLSIEIVNEKPEKFKLNQIYMLRTRDVIWVWVEDKQESGDE